MKVNKGVLIYFFFISYSKQRIYLLQKGLAIYPIILYGLAD